MLTLWLVFGSGVGWALGCRYLLDARTVQADHRERMAEISAERARLDDEIEQQRAARADRARLAPPPLDGPGDTCRIINWPTLDVHDGWSEEPAAPTPVAESGGRHALTTRRVGNT